MHLPFLNRLEERRRLRALLAGRRAGLAILYGRRRCGKSRLLREVLPPRRSVYYVGDDREESLQRASLAVEIERRVPAFAAVTYRDWDALLGRWFRDAPSGSILALDEFPAMVASSPALPSVVQKHLDAHRDRNVHLVLTGSSQRMMQGLVFDRAAPLFGRADEILRISPLSCRWIGQALGLHDPVEAVEAYAVWGGVPRYWEMAAAFRHRRDAIEHLVLSPLGVLRDEPAGLLLDDLRETTQASSILALVGAGCQRLSEIAGRLGKPATSLTRPLQRLVDLELIRRDVPIGVAPRDTKRTAYRIADPFLRFWFRFAEPARSRIEAGLGRTVAAEMSGAFGHHVAGIWEDLARAAVPTLKLGGARWSEIGRWWGQGLDGRPMEIDVVACSADGRTLLVAEVEWSERPAIDRLLAELDRKARNLPLAAGRTVQTALFLKRLPARVRTGGGARIYGPQHVVRALR
jgi:hypothetical protein